MAKLLKNVVIIGTGMLGTQIALIATYFAYLIILFRT